MNKLGIYVHIPYCIQRCSYCDFATYEKSQIMAPTKYIDLILKEIQLKHSFFNPQTLTSIYFGGGTPSLLEPELLKKILYPIEDLGFQRTSLTEVTLEINPATLTERTLHQYLEMGFNRFSVGAQTFNDLHLKKLGREHDVKDTLETLQLLKKYKTNFSLDILFALPHQTLDELNFDLDQALDLNPSHISPYCLTLNEGHPLNQNRPMDEDQIFMFNKIHHKLTENQFLRYEISNYSLPNQESQHNLLYWTDQEYWGIGLGAHSFSKSTPYGVRFWNDRQIAKYEEHILTTLKTTPLPSPLNLENHLWENLKGHEALTDFCHTSLRMERGLSLSDLATKFSPSAAKKISLISTPLIQKGLLLQKNDQLVLSQEGQMISNMIFEKFTFLELTT